MIRGLLTGQRGKVRQEPERQHSDHSADGQKSHSACFLGRQRWQRQREQRGARCLMILGMTGIVVTVQYEENKERGTVVCNITEGV